MLHKHLVGMAIVFLTLVNRSFQESIFTTFRYKNNLLVGVIAITILLLAALVYVPVFAAFFKLTPLTFHQVGISALVGFASVIWFEGYKWLRRQKP